jgi:hypothetical protein
MKFTGVGIHYSNTGCGFNYGGVSHAESDCTFRDKYLISLRCIFSLDFVRVLDELYDALNIYHIALLPLTIITLDCPFCKLKSRLAVWPVPS